jgi:MoxR-like ATPase
MENVENTPVQPVQEQVNPEILFLNESVTKVRTEINKLVVGQPKMVDLLIAGLLSGGHVLLEGVPGIAKTLTVKLLAKSLSVKFSRIQFTPDLMPTDVIGTTIFNMKTTDFNFNKGPIFANLVLIDEINRAPAKTQSALFEVMEEQQISIDGTTHLLESPFMVVATQNPIEQEGTYRLPEAQLDRFLFKIKMSYPSLEEEKLIMNRFKNDFNSKQIHTVNAVLTINDIAKCRKAVEEVYIKDELVDYIAELVYKTRNTGELFLGASPRASLAILKSSKAIAAMNGRNFVTPDDIRFVAYPVLNHRIILSPEKEMEGIQAEDVINDIIQSIQIPR